MALASVAGHAAGDLREAAQCGHAPSVLPRLLSIAAPTLLHQAATHLERFARSPVDALFPAYLQPGVSDTSFGEGVSSPGPRCWWRHAVAQPVLWEETAGSEGSAAFSPAVLVIVSLLTDRAASAPVCMASAPSAAGAPAAASAVAAARPPGTAVTAPMQLVSPSHLGVQQWPHAGAEEGLLLAGVVAAVTAFSVDGTRVLQQNNISLQCYGDRAATSPGKPGPRAVTAPDGPVTTALLDEIFCLEPAKLERLWQEVAMEGRVWRGIVKVPVANYGTAATAAGYGGSNQSRRHSGVQHQDSSQSERRAPHPHQHDLSPSRAAARSPGSDGAGGALPKVLATALSTGAAADGRALRMCASAAPAAPQPVSCSSSVRRKSQYLVPSQTPLASGSEGALSGCLAAADGSVDVCAACDGGGGASGARTAAGSNNGSGSGTWRGRLLTASFSRRKSLLAAVREQSVGDEQEGGVAAARTSAAAAAASASAAHQQQYHHQGHQQLSSQRECFFLQSAFADPEAAEAAGAGQLLLVEDDDGGGGPGGSCLLAGSAVMTTDMDPLATSTWRVLVDEPSNAAVAASCGAAGACAASGGGAGPGVASGRLLAHMTMNSAGAAGAARTGGVLSGGGGGYPVVGAGCGAALHATSSTIFQSRHPGNHKSASARHLLLAPPPAPGDPGSSPAASLPSSAAVPGVPPRADIPAAGAATTTTGGGAARRGSMLLMDISEHYCGGSGSVNGAVALSQAAAAESAGISPAGGRGASHPIQQQYEVRTINSTLQLLQQDAELISSLSAAGGVAAADSRGVAAMPAVAVAAAAWQAAGLTSVAVNGRGDSNNASSHGLHRSTTSVCDRRAAPRRFATGHLLYACEAAGSPATASGCGAAGPTSRVLQFAGSLLDLQQQRGAPASASAAASSVATLQAFQLMAAAGPAALAAPAPSLPASPMRRRQTLVAQPSTVSASHASGGHPISGAAAESSSVTDHCSFGLAVDSAALALATELLMGSGKLESTGDAELHNGTSDLDGRHAVARTGARPPTLTHPRPHVGIELAAEPAAAQEPVLARTVSSTREPSDSRATMAPKAATEEPAPDTTLRLHPAAAAAGMPAGAPRSVAEDGHVAAGTTGTAAAAACDEGAVDEFLGACGMQEQRQQGDQLTAAGPIATAAAATAGATRWHEMTASRVRDPVTGAFAVVLVQVDVTAKVEAERHIAHVSEAEHRLLEQIFPRHVLAYMTQQGGPWSSAAAAEQPASADASQPLHLLPGSWRPVVRDINQLATRHGECTLLFADIQGFTPMCKVLDAQVVMTFLNDLFSRFDRRLDEMGVYKVETIGDCYFVCGGLMHEDEDGMAAVRARESNADPDHAYRVFAFAQAMLEAASRVKLPTTGGPVRMRVGLHTGPVVSGVVGRRMPRFCLFGDTVNTTSRMESSGRAGCIHVSESTYELLWRDVEGWVPTGGIEVKGKGQMHTYLWAPPGADLEPDVAEVLRRSDSQHQG